MKYFRIIIGLFIFSLSEQSCSFNTEVVKLQNKISDETIFLRYDAWCESSIISTNHFSEIDTCYDIVVRNTGLFFYKFENDTLIIHNYSTKMPPEENIKKRFKTKIVYWEMKNSNADNADFGRVYKNLGFKFFPPTYEYVVQNYCWPRSW
jgi:hypothetical protein